MPNQWSIIFPLLLGISILFTLFGRVILTNWLGLTGRNANRLNMVLIAGIWTTLFVFRIDSYTGNVELTRWANAYIKNWWVLIVIAAWLLFMYKDKIRQAIRRRFPDQRQ